MSPRRPKIIIAGAGIGGLVAALALLRRGFEVEMYEQAATLRAAGPGLILARALETRGDDVVGAFQPYEVARHDHTPRVFNGSGDNTKRFHDPALAAPAGA